MDYETNSWAIENVCTDAAIYGDDGSPWAFSQNFPELKTYEHDLEGMGGEVKKVSVDEVQCCIKAAQGVRNPTEAGIRIGGKKYMLTYHDDEANCANLTCVGGGAAVAKMGTGVVIALWSKEAQQSDGKFQTGPKALTQVQDMAAYLKEQGY